MSRGRQEDERPSAPGRDRRCAGRVSKRSSAGESAARPGCGTSRRRAAPSRRRPCRRRARAHPSSKSSHPPLCNSLWRVNLATSRQRVHYRARLFSPRPTGARPAPGSSALPRGARAGRSIWIGSDSPLGTVTTCRLAWAAVLSGPATTNVTTNDASFCPSFVSVPVAVQPPSGPGAHANAASASAPFPPDCPASAGDEDVDGAVVGGSLADVLDGGPQAVSSPAAGTARHPAATRRSRPPATDLIRRSHHAVRQDRLSRAATARPGWRASAPAPAGWGWSCRPGRRQPARPAVRRHAPAARAPAARARARVVPPRAPGPRR